MCPTLNSSGQTTCLSGAARARKLPLLDGVTSLTEEPRGGVDDLALRHLLLSMLLWRSSRSRPLSRSRRCLVIHRHASLPARWRLSLADAAGSLQARFARSIIDIRFSSRVVGRSLCYDVVHRLSPLLCQSDKGRAFRCHTLNWLHNSLEPHGVEVRVQILDHPIIGRSGIRCF
jgi:hypothetical protein